MKSRTNEPDGLNGLQKPFEQWFTACVYTDPRWLSGFTALHADFCRWMVEQDQVVPPTRDEFRRLLTDSGHNIRAIFGEEFVSNIALMEEVEAHERFNLLEPKYAPLPTMM